MNVPVITYDFESAPSSAALNVAADIANKLQDALMHAYACGVVITVDLEPLEPLAMRNYRMRANVRHGR